MGEGESEPTWRSTLHAAILVPNPGGGPRFLLVPKGDAWALPRVVLPKQVWTPACGPFMSALREKHGIDAVVLRRAASLVDRTRREVEAIYVLEPKHANPTLSPATRAIDREALSGLRLALPAQRSVLDRCLAELAGTTPAFGLQPWMHPGWFAEAGAWIDRQILRAGKPPTGSVEQVSSWGISSVLRVPTSDGDVYFKAIPPGSGDAAREAATGAKTGLLFANEPALVAALAARFPDSVPSPLAIDAERRWMLLADVGSPLASSRDIALWNGVMRRVARLQIASAGQVDELARIGCLDRRLETLPGEIGPLLADPNVLDVLGTDRLARLRALAPRLRTACAALARFDLPPTLVHGDLHAANIAVREGSANVFDWTDACIAHPFVDASLLPLDADRVLDEPDAGARLLVAYLSEWTAFAPIEQLREAYTVAKPIVALHHAISYRSIVANVDPVSAVDLPDGLGWALADLLASVLEPGLISEAGSLGR